MMRKQITLLILALATASGVRGAEEDQDEYSYSRPVVPEAVTKAAAVAQDTLKVAIPSATTQLVATGVETTGDVQEAVQKVAGDLKSFFELVAGPIVEKLGLAEKITPEKLAQLEEKEEDDEATQGSSMLQQSAQDDKKERLHAVDSPVIRKRLEELSGKKVDEKILTSTYKHDPTAAAKTIMGSVPMFRYLRAKRGGALDESTQVDGLEMLETKVKAAAGDADCGSDPLTPSCDDLKKAAAPRNTPPLVEFEIEKKAIAEILAEAAKPKDSKKAADDAKKEATKKVSTEMKAFQIIYWMWKNGKLTKALDNPMNLDQWAKPIEDDVEVADYLARPENSEIPPEEMEELSDIPDWLNHKI